MEPKLNFAHVCENAFLSLDKKINIIGGDFDSIFIERDKNLPGLFFSFFVITNFSVTSNKEYDHTVILKSVDNNQIITTVKSPLKTTGNKVGVILNIRALFPQYGKYRILIEFDSIKHNIDFLVKGKENI